MPKKEKRKILYCRETLSILPNGTRTDSTSEMLESKGKGKIGGYHWKGTAPCLKKINKKAEKKQFLEDVAWNQATVLCGAGDNGGFTCGLESTSRQCF